MAPTENAEAVRQLPIDIAYNKLPDWLVDRRKIPSDWRKKLALIRNRINSALTALPKDADPPDSVEYLDVKRISGMLADTNQEERNMFGRLSGVAAEWKTIARAYEKEFIFLGEAAQRMIQNVNYEIPFQRKQIAKFQQQLSDLEKKEAEFKRNASASALKYVQACQELKIEGKNVRAELLASVNLLPEVFAEVTNALCSEVVGEALEYYQAFVKYAHAEEESGLVLGALREVRENPAAFSGQKISSRSTVPSQPDQQSDLPIAQQTDLRNQLHLTEPGNELESSNELEEGGIEWDIDFDISTDAAAPEDAVAVDLSSQVNVVEEEISEIVWDIDLEETGGVGDGNVDGDGAAVSEDVGDGVKNDIVGRSRLASIEDRNKMLDDLLELKSFLKQRLQDDESKESSALRNQMQAVAHITLQQYSVLSLKNMEAEISNAVGLLTNSRTRDLLMILTSTRFLNTLEASLLQKKQSELKLVAGLKDIERRRYEYRNSLSLALPKQESLIAKTRELKLNVEKVLSAQFDGRPVNIIGEINTCIGSIS